MLTIFVYRGILDNASWRKELKNKYLLISEECIPRIEFCTLKRTKKNYHKGILHVQNIPR